MESPARCRRGVWIFAGRTGGCRGSAGRWRDGVVCRHRFPGRGVLPVDRGEWINNRAAGLSVSRLMYRVFSYCLLPKSRSSQVLPVWRSPWRMRGLRLGLFFHWIRESVRFLLIKIFLSKVCGVCLRCMFLRMDTCEGAYGECLR